MNNLFFVLILLSILAMVIGLIKPGFVIFWGTAKRSKVLLIFGLILVFSFILFAATLDETDLKNESEKTVEVKTAPYASVIYDITCEGKNNTGVELFRAFSPEKVRVCYSDNLFIMNEEGGTLGYVIADFDKKEAFMIDTINKKATKAIYTDVEETMRDENMQKLLPNHYRPKLRETSDKEVILGYNCKKYEVLKSGFIRAYAKAEIWVTEELLLKPMRYDFQTDSKRIMTPLPLQLGVEKGTVMKAVVDENDVVVTFFITSLSLEKPDDALLSIPVGYERKE